MGALQVRMVFCHTSDDQVQSKVRSSLQAVRSASAIRPRAFWCTPISQAIVVSQVGQGLEFPVCVCVLGDLRNGFSFPLVSF